MKIPRLMAVEVDSNAGGAAPPPRVASKPVSAGAVVLCAEAGAQCASANLKSGAQAGGLSDLAGYSASIWRHVSPLSVIKGPFGRRSRVPTDRRGAAAPASSQLAGPQATRLGAATSLGDGDHAPRVHRDKGILI
jgi:hypothetical protein